MWLNVCPLQADLNSSGMQDGPGSFYGVSSQYSSIENMTITVSTKVCSFGKQVVEKVEVRMCINSLFSSQTYGTYDTDTRCCMILTLLCVLQTEYARLEGGKCVYRIHRSPMCEYMINFIHKLKHLPEKYMMNSVLENFTILQVTYTQLYQIFNYFTALQYIWIDYVASYFSPNIFPFVLRWWRTATPRRPCSV